MHIKRILALGIIFLLLIGVASAFKFPLPFKKESKYKKVDSISTKGIKTISDKFKTDIMKDPKLNLFEKQDKIKNIKEIKKIQKINTKNYFYQRNDGVIIFKNVK